MYVVASSSVILVSKAIYWPKLPVLAFWLLLWLVLPGCTQVETEKERSISIFDTFKTTQVTKMEIATNLDSLVLNKEDENYQRATLTFSNSIGQNIATEIDVSARGKMRKNFCTLPPIRLKFSKKKLQNAGLAKFKTLKLVFPCKDTPEYEDYILREFLCYELCQMLVGNSFRVQMLDLTLKDDRKDSIQLTGHAFLIEHEDEMALRLGGEILSDSDLKVTSIDAEGYHKVVLFQYLIGNTDWNLVQRHNIKLVDRKDGNAPLPVPYDFDCSGLVNSEYAQPHPNLPVDDIRDRFFQWRGQDRLKMNQCIESYRDKKNDVLNLIDQFPYLSGESRLDIRNYVLSFYQRIEHPDPLSIL